MAASVAIATPPTIGFVGAGTVAGVLGSLLAKAGYRVARVASRTCASAERFADSVEGCTAVAAAGDVAAACDLVFLTVPDGAIADVCSATEWRPGKAAVHCSGATPLDALSAASAAGAAVAAFHPLQTFADAARGRPLLRGSSVAVETPDLALKELLYGIAGDLGCHPFALPPGSRALYHVSAVMASNHLVTLIADAAELWGRFGFDRSSGLRALLPLVQGTVSNLESAGLPGALTGPVARGDVVTVKANLEALDGEPPDVGAAHRAMTRRTLKLARERGVITEENEAGILALLEGEGGQGEAER